MDQNALKMMRKFDFLHVDTDSWKVNLTEKYYGGLGQEWLWPLWSQDSEIGCVSRRN